MIKIKQVVLTVLALQASSLAYAFNQQAQATKESQIIPSIKARSNVLLSSKKRGLSSSKSPKLRTESSNSSELSSDKVVLNSSTYKNPDLIREISNVFGSQSIVHSIDCKKNKRNKYRIN